MIPIRDDQARSTIPYVNYFIIALNVAVFACEISVGLHDRRALNDLFQQFGTIPHNFELAISGGYAQLTIPSVFVTIFTSMFMHASVLHLLGNMWVLWIFGDNIEDHLGHFVYLIFYLVCGVLASMAHIYANPGSEIPSVGASGAIAGVMGAFLLRYPQARVQMLVVFGWMANVTWLSAWACLLVWVAVSRSDWDTDAANAQPPAVRRHCLLGPPGWFWGRNVSDQTDSRAHSVQLRRLDYKGWQGSPAEAMNPACVCYSLALVRSQ